MNTNHKKFLRAVLVITTPSDSVEEYMVTADFIKDENSAVNEVIRWQTRFISSGELDRLYPDWISLGVHVFRETSARVGCFSRQDANGLLGPS